MHPHADALNANLPNDRSADALTLLLSGGRVVAIADAGVLTLHEIACRARLGQTDASTRVMHQRGEKVVSWSGGLTR